MKPIEAIEAELTLKLDEIVQICERYKYDVIPTLVLRHHEGANKSIVMGNDSLGKVVLCIAEVGATGKVSSESARDAALKLFLGGM